MIDTYKLYGRYFQLFNFLSTLQNPKTHLDETYLERLKVEKDSLTDTELIKAGIYEFEYAYRLKQNGCSILLCILPGIHVIRSPQIVNDIFSTLDKTIIIPISKSLLMLDIKHDDRASFRKFEDFIRFYFESVILMDNDIYFEPTDDLDSRIDLITDIMSVVFIKHFMQSVKDYELTYDYFSKYKEFQTFFESISKQQIINNNMKELLPLYTVAMTAMENEERDDEE